MIQNIKKQIEFITVVLNFGLIIDVEISYKNYASAVC